MKDAFQLGQQALKVFFIPEMGVNNSEVNAFKILFYLSISRNANTNMASAVFQDVYNSRPLPFIICTARFNENNDAGLSGIEYVEEEVEPEPAPAPSTSQGEDQNIKYDDGEGYDDIDGYENDNGDESVPNRPLPPPPRPSTAVPQHNDDNDEVGGAEVEVDRPPRPPANGGSLKDMLNAQIRARGNGDVMPPGPPAAADQDDSGPGPTGRPLPPPPRRPDQASATVDNEEEEEEDDDLFTTKDDPYSLFSANRSTFKVRLFFILSCSCD